MVLIPGQQVPSLSAWSLNQFGPMAQLLVAVDGIVVSQALTSHRVPLAANLVSFQTRTRSPVEDSAEPLVSYPPYVSAQAVPFGKRPTEYCVGSAESHPASIGRFQLQLLLVGLLHQFCQVGDRALNLFDGGLQELLPLLFRGPVPALADKK